MDPNVVRTQDFGQIFRTQLPGNFNNLAPEQVYSQPLVYTGTDGVQYVYVATTQNNIYKLDAKTGTIIASRNLHVPFLQADLESCTDISPTIGVTATGVIDPDTGIWYLTSKTYSEQFQDGNFSPTNTPGRLNGRYWQHAVHTEDLSEAAGWPVLLDGTIFRNNPDRMFLGGNQHSRPGALLVGDYVYTGYASHCVQYNYTGAIIGFHRKTGQIVEAFATEGGPEPNSIRGGGIWMSGGGLSYDGKGSMYFATGNGYASQLKATGNSVPGRTPPTSLEEAAVNAKINDDGTLTIIDFFMPWEKTQLDGADKDLGTSPLEILPSNVFSCPNHRRIGVVTGKSGKTYWLNLDNLGGYQNGLNKLDDVIQVYQNENVVYAGAGVMPLSGGYVYIPVTGNPTHVFKFYCDPSGNAAFTKVADTPEINGGGLGTGHGTTTSLNDQEGTGLLWISDVQGANLRIYDPIPPSDGGPLTLLNSFNIGSPAKFTRPVFGNGRVYIGNAQGYVFGFGAPVVTPLNCSSPYDFGNLPIGNVSAPLTITCTAIIGTVVGGVNLTSSNFKISAAPATPLTLSPGQSFSFSAVFNPKSVGSLSDDARIAVTNSQAGYSTAVPVTLKGTGRSANPLLVIAPSTISFSVIAGQASSTQSSLFWNFGDSILNFSSINFSLVSEQGPWIQPNTTSDGSLQVGQFVFGKLPTTIQPTSSVPIRVVYAPAQPGNHAVYVKAISNGGSALLDVFGVAGTNPKAVIEFQTVDGSGWVTYSNSTPFTFGTVLEGTTRTLLVRITNGGGPNAVPLPITVSKPPYGIPGIIGKANNIDLGEGTSIKANESQTAQLFCSVPKSQVNVPSYNGTTSWTLNTGDPNLGKISMQFLCNAAAEQVGALFPNGTAKWPYVGCFKENNPGRQLATNIFSDNVNMTIGRCIDACSAAGYIFAGPQYMQECWCGNAIPIQMSTDSNCNYACTGNQNQSCGGDGIFHDSSWISLFADPTRFNGNTTSPPLQLTQRVGNYSFAGCYAETTGKTLSAASTASNVMTVEACSAYCSAYPYFGLEYSAECFCGSTLSPASTITDSSQCNMLCKGSNSEYCGAGSRMQVYQLNASSSATSSASLSSTATSSTTSSAQTSSGSSTSSSSIAASTSSSSSQSSIISASTTSTTAAPTSTTSVTSLGCYNDIPGRALAANSVANDSMTVDLCKAFCTGAVYFGVEYGRECYCGNSIPSSSTATTDGRCNMACAGNPSQTCGGPNGLNMYQNSKGAQSNPAQVSGYQAMGCFAEPPNGRLLPTVYANDGMTIEMCAAKAAAGGFSYFGTEWRRECWMGGSLGSTAPSDSSNCLLSCGGNVGEICGGAGYLNVYGPSTLSSSASSSASPSTKASTPVSSSSPTTSTSTSSPTGTPMCPSWNTTTYTTPSGSKYRIECSIDHLDSDLTMSYTTSYTACLALCDSTPSCTALSWVSGSAVSMPCYLKTTASPSSSTNPTIWGAVQLSPPPSSASISSYTYTGCYTEPPSSRALSASSYTNTTSMTPALCAAYCSAYAFFGLEYGQECYCGPYLSPSSSPAQKTSDCSMPCVGDKSTVCGGPARLSVYRSSDPSKVSSDPKTAGPVIGNYSYAYCTIDTAAPRALGMLLFASDGLTTAMCVAAAEAQKMGFVAVEYGRECWGGNTFAGNSSAVGNVRAGSEAECNMVCAGARGETQHPSS
ncbi:WSC-domain-containing protein [Polyplosphaeria fusca]|uniref:WSC-domain-containing protein n=1 Tax=Polyplosphaeria fusca TaxID=682080 RepID=A0A9P4UZU2_9PLEO|nr:WSC-domain-containing protein [Polyplosphaeria fusca]